MISAQHCHSSFQHTYSQFVANLWVGFQLPIQRAVPVATNKSPVLCLYRVLACNLGVIHDEYRTARHVGMERRNRIGSGSAEAVE